MRYAFADGSFCLVRINWAANQAGRYNVGCVTQSVKHGWWLGVNTIVPSGVLQPLQPEDMATLLVGITA